VGAWRYRHYTGATAYERYTDDGRVLFRLPMTAHVGCYLVSRGQLSMTEPKLVNVRFEIRHNELIMVQEGSKEFVYSRVTAGPWYPRDPEQIKSR